jgi:hypothetical protein
MSSRHVLALLWAGTRKDNPHLSGAEAKAAERLCNIGLCGYPNSCADLAPLPECDGSTGDPGTILSDINRHMR